MQSTCQTKKNIAGDFNLDDSKRFANDFRRKILFDKLNSTCDQFNLIQLINEATWQRVINNSLKESILDHLYVTDPNYINNVKFTEPLIGDHKLITFEINTKHKIKTPKHHRNWKKISKQKLFFLLL